MAVTVQLSPFLTQPLPVVRVRSLRRVMTVSPTAIGVLDRVRDGWSGDPSFVDQLIVGELVQLPDGVVVGGDHERVQAVLGVVLPGLMELFQQSVARSGVESVVGAVGGDGGVVTVAELERGRLFPVGVEASDVGQRGRVAAVGGEEVERAAGGDGVQLGGVADEQQLRAGLFGVAGDAVEGEGAGQRGLIEDDELTCAQAPPVEFGLGGGDVLVESPLLNRVPVVLFELPVTLDLGLAFGVSVVLDQPLGRVVGRDAEFAAEDVGGGRGGREPDDRAGSVLASQTARSALMVVVLPVPAAPMRTSTTRPEVAICSTAAACSAESAPSVGWRRGRGGSGGVAAVLE